MLGWLFGTGKKDKTLIKKLSIQETHELVKAGSVLLIDVRQPNEWAEGRPQGAKGVTLQDPEFLAKVDQIAGGNKSAALVITCKAGPRAENAAAILAAAGFTDLAVMTGCWMDWAAAGLPADLPPFDA